jgi:hydroxyquinol 1,2-dioxygenase
MATDFNELTITDAVLRSISNTPDARNRQISTSLVKHLHSFVRDIVPSQEEWQFAIDFLTKVGQKCDSKRQEFILLSDTLGVSMLVDVLNNRPAGTATESTVLGPFYVQGPPEFPLGSNISQEMEGEPLYVSGTVRSATGAPLVGAVVDVWHSDKDGYYDVQQLDDLEGAAMRARFRTDEQGQFRFWTVKPAPYPIPHDGPVGQMLEAQMRHPWRPAHVHFWIEAPKHRRLITHVFSAGDPYLESDVVFAVKQSLIRLFTECAPGIAPDGRSVETPYVSLNYDFTLVPSRGL